MSAPAVAEPAQRAARARLARVLPPAVAARRLPAWLDAAAVDPWRDLCGPCDRLYLGSDLCERLLPAPAMLRAWLRVCERRGLAVSLLTPALSEAGLARLARCLALLPAGSEVVVNDWGALRRVRRARPDLVAVAGRSMARMVKDPRLPDARWARLYPGAVGAPEYSGFLADLGLHRLELDVPPHPGPQALRVPGLAISVYAPLGCASRGRLCRIGSLHQAREQRFAPGHACRRECLAWVSRVRRPAGPSTDLPTWQIGNALMYGHDPRMREALRAAILAGEVDRVVDNGALHADRRADQPAV